MEDKITRVKDPSQPIKIFLMCLALGLGVWWGLKVLEYLKIIAGK